MRLDPSWQRRRQCILFGTEDIAKTVSSAPPNTVYSNLGLAESKGIDLGDAFAIVKLRIDETIATIEVRRLARNDEVRSTYQLISTIT